MSGSTKFKVAPPPQQDDSDSDAAAERVAKEAARVAELAEAAGQERLARQKETPPAKRVSRKKVVPCAKAHISLDIWWG